MQWHQVNFKYGDLVSWRSSGVGLPCDKKLRCVDGISLKTFAAELHSLIRFVFVTFHCFLLSISLK